MISEDLLIPESMKYQFRFIQLDDLTLQKHMFFFNLFDELFLSSPPKKESIIQSGFSNCIVLKNSTTKSLPDA